MYKYKMILFPALFLIFWSCAGSNATTMEYRSATTAVRSERDMKKGEEYALKALDMEMHANDARVAYFLAIEIYKPFRNWEEMNRMLDIAMERNPEQLLERPFKLTDEAAKRSYYVASAIDAFHSQSNYTLDHSVISDEAIMIKTISQAVIVYKEQVWMNSFNQVVELVEVGRFEEALEKINFTKTVLEKIDNYLTSCLLNMELENIDNAKKDLEAALKIEPNNHRALHIAGDIAQSEGDLEEAKKYYEKAMESVINIEIVQSLIGVNIALQNYDEAIELSNNLLAGNPDDPDIYFNVGVIYQRLASNLYDETVSQYNILTKEDVPSETLIKNTYANCTKTLDMVKLALNYFMDASMLEEDENTDTEIAMKDMKRLRKNIKNIYIGSIEQIAKDYKVDLD